MTQRVVIIGGGAAGPKTAAKLRRENPDMIIEMYTDENHVSYSACGLPYYIENIIPDIEELLVRSPEEFERHGIKVFLEHKAIKIDKEKQTVIFEKHPYPEQIEVFYDILVIATGARPYLPDIENLHDFKNIYTLRKLEDGIAIKNAMKKAKTATIIGLGYIGIELLEAFIKNGLEVSVINNHKFIMPMFDEDISKQIEKHILEKDGDKIKIYNNQHAVKITGENEIASKIITDKGNEIETDFIIISTGIVPNSEIAKEAGLKTGVKGSIWVNSHFATSYPKIYAVGDCCEKTHIVTKKHCWLPLGSTANKEGRCAAINIASGNCDFQGVLGAAVSRYFDYTVCMTGITEREAKALGYDVLTTTVTKEDRAGYMPEAATITLKMIVDSKSREILGIQGIGNGDAEKRVATVSMAIMNGVKIDEFMGLDLPYAPPFSTAIDPLLNALQKIEEKLKENT
ncbi:MAG: FAD-dependent oxidoreductase [Candidatus Gastranaerophilales bacterium]|nr:FAD-dependent oxidoreductase [Candidatus Gastranaerophilales bacterium]